ncbi:MAG: hypothetical protein N3D18_08450 [Roseococcus sp.]|nr:hypothetical protein [Roseococcus sp.]
MRRRPALVLARAGVINHDEGGVHRIEAVHLREGLFDPWAQALGSALVGVTDRAGVGRGLLGEAEFAARTGRKPARVAERGILGRRMGVFDRTVAARAAEGGEPERIMIDSPRPAHRSPSAARTAPGHGAGRRAGAPRFPRAGTPFRHRVKT